MGIEDWPPWAIGFAAGGAVAVVVVLIKACLLSLFTAKPKPFEPDPILKKGVNDPLFESMMKAGVGKMD